MYLAQEWEAHTNAAMASILKNAQERGLNQDARRYELDLTAVTFTRSITCGDLFSPVCSTVIIPRSEPAGNIIQFFGRDDIASLPVLADVKFADYHYQNQADPPDNVPSKEWKERKRVWTREIYKQESVPARIGLSFDLLTEEEACISAWGAWCDAMNSDPETTEVYSRSWQGYYMGISCARQIPETQLDHLMRYFKPHRRAAAFRALTGVDRHYHWPSEQAGIDGAGI